MFVFKFPIHFEKLPRHFIVATQRKSDHSIYLILVFFKASIKKFQHTQRLRILLYPSPRLVNNSGLILFFFPHQCFPPTTLCDFW